MAYAKGDGSDRRTGPATNKTGRVQGLQDTHLKRITTVLWHAGNTLILQRRVLVRGVLLAERTVGWIRCSSRHRRNTIIGPGIGCCCEGNSRLETQSTGNSQKTHNSLARTRLLQAC